MLFFVAVAFIFTSSIIRLVTGIEGPFCGYQPRGDAEEFLLTHNMLRSLHGTQKVTWNTTLQTFARQWAQSQNCTMVHSGGPYGENLAKGYKTVTAAVKGWYREIKDWDFAAGTGVGPGQVLHFTQMVWNGTRQIGCHVEPCGKTPLAVCEYYPRGNIVGQFVKNVPPVKDEYAGCEI